MSHYMTALAMRQTGLRPATKIVLYWLADHHNERSGECFPSISRLAELSEMSRRSVEGHLSDLQDAGLVSISPRFRAEGGKTSSAYILHIGESDAQNLRIPPAKSAHGDAQNLRMNNPVINNLGNEQEPNGSLEIAQPDIFPEFWDRYPHRNGAKKGKAAALKVWARLIKSGTIPKQIIEGAARYAGDRQVIEGYAKDPATWLNQRGWEDEIEPPKPTGAKNDRAKQSAAINEFANRLSSGEVRIDYSNRDPFAHLR